MQDLHSQQPRADELMRVKIYQMQLRVLLPQHTRLERNRNLVESAGDKLEGTARCAHCVRIFRACSRLPRPSSALRTRCALGLAPGRLNVHVDSRLCTKVCARVCAGACTWSYQFRNSSNTVCTGACIRPAQCTSKLCTRVCIKVCTGACTCRAANVDVKLRVCARVCIEVCVGSGQCIHR